MTLAEVPGEIVYMVFLKMDSIDDCLHLARSCRKLYSLFGQFRLPILRSTIYDIQLCHFLDAYWAWASQHLQDYTAWQRDPPIDVHYPPGVFASCKNAKALNDEHVWDIVARWQGLAVLRDLYLQPSISETYCRSPLIEWESYHPPLGGDAQKRRLIEAQPVIDIQERASDLPSREKEGIYPRLYLALTHSWLRHSAMRLAEICTYPRQSQQNMVWDQIEEICMGGMSLLDAMQVLEAYDFTWDYLIAQLPWARVGTFGAWVVEGDVMGGPNEPPNSRWAFFLGYLRDCLSPADVIELSILSHHWKRNSQETPEWGPPRKRQYLKERLFVRLRFTGSVLVRDVGTEPETIYTVLDLEEAVQRMLNTHHSVGGQSWDNIWQHYRRNRWVGDARGKALAWNLSDEMVAKRIRSVSGIPAPTFM